MAACVPRASLDDGLIDHRLELIGMPNPPGLWRWIMNRPMSSLEVRKVYRRIEDSDAARHGQIRVVDESGEDYLYPTDYFSPVELPAEVERSLCKPA